ncbi:MAG TPA: SDR family oxidoreductase [Bacteroidia bacterium]|jgi:thioester reductase-like protein
MKNVFITGATGFLGGELLVDLSKREEVGKIYCLVRAGTFAEAQQRLKKVFDFHKDVFDPSRIIPVEGDLAQENLSEYLSSRPEIRDVHYIVHSAANTSFSPIYDKMVEEINIHGLNKILKWSQSLKTLETFVYIGTATICGKQVKNRTVKETESPDLNAEHLVKYTYTKMQGEIEVKNHLPEDKILIVRPSIILGDSRPWTPRSYVIMWTLACMNFLRLIPANANTLLDMIPVDYVSNAITRIIFSKRKYNVYHISAGENGCTTPAQLAKTIEAAFPEAPKFNFIGREMVRDVKMWARKRLNDDSGLYQHPEYLNYWQNIMSDTSELRVLMGGLDPYIEFMELGQVFDNSRMMQEEFGLEQSKPAHEYISNSIHLLKNIDIFEAALEP